MMDDEAPQAWADFRTSSAKGIMSEAKIRSLRKDALRREQNLEGQQPKTPRSKDALDRILGGRQMYPTPAQDAVHGSRDRFPAPPGRRAHHPLYPRRTSAVSVPRTR